MHILLFDMDGVLLEPKGYHQALIETVRLTSLSLGFEEIKICEEDIAQFESLGISNEWHSSAMCVSLMVIEAQKRNLELNLSPQLRLTNPKYQAIEINLPGLYPLISDQTIDLPALPRSLKAIQQAAEKVGVDPTISQSIMEKCEQIDHSLTLNIFQELVLGSEIYTQLYGKQARVNTRSYLDEFDKPMLSEDKISSLKAWLDDPLHYAAIMTNRPSNTLLGTMGTPEAELGAALVGVDFLPMIGSGEIHWLGNKIGQHEGSLVKPSAHHALSAIFAAMGQSPSEALQNSARLLSGEGVNVPSSLSGCTVTIFEDTPAGILAVDNAKSTLKKLNLDIQVQKVGITTDASKKKSLKVLGAKVFATINEAIDGYL